MEETLLRVENLKTSFMTSNGEVQAVRGVPLEVRRGEIAGIVGESGFGKSITNMTLLKLFPDTAAIKGGRAMFQGQDLTKLSMKELRKIRREKIAMIFQDPMSSLNPLIPVGEQVAKITRIHHSDRSREAVKQEVLKRFAEVCIPEPEERYHAYPHESSDGMRQCVMIVMTLANNPELLIVDKPTTALDVTIRNQIIRQVRKFKEQHGISIILITHDLGVIAELCEKVEIMYGGLIMEEAPIDELFEHPSHPYTLGSLESMPSIQQDKAERLTPIPDSPPDMTNLSAGCPSVPRCRYTRKVCAAELLKLQPVGEGHSARYWLLDSEAPAEQNPFKKR